MAAVAAASAATFEPRISSRFSRSSLFNVRLGGRELARDMKHAADDLSSFGSRDLLSTAASAAVIASDRPPQAWRPVVDVAAFGVRAKYRTA